MSESELTFDGLPIRATKARSEVDRRYRSNVPVEDRRSPDITGERFHRLTVMGRVANLPGSAGSRWLCWCDCGTSVEVSRTDLTKGHAKSCGCYRKEYASQAHSTHGMSKTRLYGLFNSARKRARDRGMDFTLELDDLIVPEYCPVLGMKLSFEGDKECSPSLDRWDQSKGYTKENVRIISWRANRIKSDATYAEIAAIAEYMQP